MWSIPIRAGYRVESSRKSPRVKIASSLSDPNELEQSRNRADVSGVPQSHDNPHVRVVVVEDDRLFRSVLATYCRSIGMRVVAEVPDGQAALEMLSDDTPCAGEHPDLILTDCQMPRMDGISLVRHLRARGDGTPVIMLSGQHDARVAEVARAAGVNCFLPKPLSTQSFRDALEQTFPGWAA